jgi:uncharacterized protein
VTETSDTSTAPLVDADLLEEMIRAIVERTEDVRIEERASGAATELWIHVHPSDRCHVIGRQGRTIQSLRHMFSVVAARQGRRITLEVIESDTERQAMRGPKPAQPKAVRS